MGIDKSFELGSYIATIFSAATAFFAIRQSIMQRKLSIKPQLLIKRIEISAENMEKNRFSTEPFRGADLTFSHPTIINTGPGTALNITIRWEYPYLSKMNLLRGYYTKSNRNLKLDLNINDKLGVECLEIDTGDIILHPIKKKDFIDFIIPINLAHNEYKLQIPTSIYKLMVNEAMILPNLKNKAFNIIEGPALHMDYTDIEGKRYSQKYKSHFKVMQIKELLYSNSLTGTLYFQGAKISMTDKIKLSFYMKIK